MLLLSRISCVLCRGERWSIASVVDWPDNRQFSWRDFSQAELRRGFPLGPTACDLQDVSVFL